MNKFIASLPIALLFFVLTTIGCGDSSDSGGYNIDLNFRFVDKRDGTVTDTDSGLIWLKDANTFGKMAWQDAMSEAAALSTGNHGLMDGSSPGDWRLPTGEEWEAFVDRNYSAPALCNSAGTSQHVDGDPFINIMGTSADSVHWSSTYRDCDCGIYIARGCATTMNMETGVSYSNYCAVNNFYVWPVR